MSERFIESFAEKLILLEKKTGERVPSYQLMRPFIAPFYDSLSIQKAAKQKENVGGRIELDNEVKWVRVPLQF